MPSHARAFLFRLLFTGALVQALPPRTSASCLLSLPLLLLLLLSPDSENPKRTASPASSHCGLHHGLRLASDVKLSGTHSRVFPYSKELLPPGTHFRVFPYSKHLLPPDSENSKRVTQHSVVSLWAPPLSPVSQETRPIFRAPIPGCFRFQSCAGSHTSVFPPPFTLHPLLGHPLSIGRASRDTHSLRHPHPGVPVFDFLPGTHTRVFPFFTFPLLLGHPLLTGRG